MLANPIRCIPSAAVAALAVVTLGAAAPAPGVIPPTAPSAVTVNIDNFVFGPQAVTVPVGASVTWTNRDDIPHTVVAVDRSFRSKVLDTDEKFSFTFTRAGTFDYFCSIHPHMIGKVVVKGP
jgi:plastocyanin